jgi:hypothetical protein
MDVEKSCRDCEILCCRKETFERNQAELQLRIDALQTVQASISDVGDPFRISVSSVFDSLTADSARLANACAQTPSCCAFCSLDVTTTVWTDEQRSLVENLSDKGKQVLAQVLKLNLICNANRAQILTPMSNAIDHLTLALQAIGKLEAVDIASSVIVVQKMLYQ